MEMDVEKIYKLGGYLLLEGKHNNKIIWKTLLW